MASISTGCLTFLIVRINDTVTFVEDGFDEDIEFGDEISDDDEDDVDNVSFHIFEQILLFKLLPFGDIKNFRILLLILCLRSQVK